MAGSASGKYPNRLVARLADAGFVSLCARADGDALAATGVLAGALAAIDTPFQATVRRLGNTGRTATETDLLVRIGPADPMGESENGEHGNDGGTDDDDSTVSLPGDPVSASLAATGVVRELDGGFDPSLALAGGIAAAVRDARDPFGDGPFGDDLEALLDRAREENLAGERRPGIAVPTVDTMDGLAHTSLAHAPFSGDPDTVRERCGPLARREDVGREIASLLGCSVVGAAGSTPRATVAIERALRPIALPGSATPSVTLGGYADVLIALAAERPGIGLALALGYDVREAALAAWRTHTRRAHAALRTATISRYDGLCVARLAAVGNADGSGGTDGEGGGDGGHGDSDAPGSDERTPVATVARLLRDFRSPEPVALVVGERVGALSATEDRALGELVVEATRDLGGTGSGAERAAEARFDGDPEGFVTAVRTELAERDRTDSGERGEPRQGAGGQR
jgi:hypothetical protein